MKDKLYIMRDTIYSDGLLDLINYINGYSNTKDMNMIEIGSYSGESTEMFSKHFKSVISIDPFINDYDLNDPACSFMDFNNVYEIFSERIRNLSNVKHIRKTSDDAVKELKNELFDFVYIDGLHTYEQVKKDIKNYIKLISNKGFIGGHDYHKNWEGVIKVVHEELNGPDEIFKDTSWIKRKENVH